MIRDLATDFRTGTVDDAKIRRCQAEGFETFRLATDARPNLLRNLVRLDDEFLKRTKIAVDRSKHAGRRVGREWGARGSKNITKTDADDSWATRDDLQPFNEACTKWCSETFFPDALSRIHMVCNFVRLYDRLRDITGLKFDICFKGGVMMRLILLEFLKDLPSEARDKALAYCSEHRALSISDFDFEIVPRDHDPPEHMIHRFFALDFAVLLWFQRRLQLDLEKRDGQERRDAASLLNLDWNVEKRRKALHEALQLVADGISDKSHPMYAAHIDRVVVQSSDPSPPKGYSTKSGKATPDRRDNVVVFDCDDAKKCVVPAERYFDALAVPGIPARSGGSFLYATLNSYIGEDAERTSSSHRLGLFHLARIKHGFVVYYTTHKGAKRCDRLGGELIDLSQSHGASRDELRRDLYRSVSRPYRSYPILGVDASTVQLRSYSVEGFVADLRLQIHANDTPPWCGDARKMSKRIVRYVAFFFAHVLGPHVPGSRAKKRAALGRAVEATSSLKALRNASPTSVAAVNAFVERERATVGEKKGSENGIVAYLKSVHGHLAFLVSLLDVEEGDTIILVKQYFRGFRMFDRKI